MANTHSLDLESTSSQYASGSETNFPTGNGSRSFEFWIKPESLPGMTPLAYGTRSDYDAWQLYIHTDGKLAVDTFNNFVSAYSTSALSTGSWQHVAITYDGTTIRYYINATAVGTATFANTPTTALNTGVYIGANNNGTQFFVDGLLDEVRVWNDVRTPTEITDNYQTELIGNEAGLVGYWKLNNSYLDETSNNNDLTASGSPVFSTDVPFGGGITFIPKIMIF